MSRRRKRIVSAPGTRIPALIVSPYAKRGTVDHTQYDTTSILRFITNRWNLPVLPGIDGARQALLPASIELHQSGISPGRWSSRSGHIRAAFTSFAE